MPQRRWAVAGTLEVPLADAARALENVGKFLVRGWRVKKGG
jgi:hypothetical protein